MRPVVGRSPTTTGLSWLGGSATALVASAVGGARLVAVVGVRRRLVTGPFLGAIVGTGVGLVETMRANAVAAMSTVLVSQTGPNGYHAAPGG